MTASDWIQLSGAVATFVAVLLAPLIALWIGGVFQRRSDATKQKLTILGVLISLRHDQLAPDAIRSLNLIDAVFADDFEVREAWTKYFAVLNDAALNNPIGWSLRAEKRHELLMAMVAAVKLKGKISSADLLRAYIPQAIGTQATINYWEQQVKLKQIEEFAAKYGVSIDLTSAFTPNLPQEPKQ